MIDSPISSAIADRMRRSERFSESATAASKARARPSQLRNEPDFSVIAATGRTTSATLVTAECAISSEITNDLESAASAAALFGISCGSTPPTTTASSEPLPRLSIISEVVRPTFAGIVGTPQTVAISTRAAASAIGRPPGRSVPIAPASSAPRSPARRGIQASFAPLFSASAETAESRPVVSAARSPTKMTDLPVKESAESAAPSAPGATLINSAFNFSSPIESLVATALTFRARLRTCLLMRRKTIGDSSSGSKPMRTT